LVTVDANGLPATTGTTYYEFRLDINQSGSAPYLSLNKLQIYQHGTADLNTLAAVQSTALPSDHRAYDLDANGDHTVLLNASLGAGSGSGGGVVDNADLIVLVPTANFNLQAGGFIYLYSEFGTSGGGWVSNGGFEEWGALTPLVTTISDTATVTATAGTGNQTVSDSDTASYIGPASGSAAFGQDKKFWSDNSQATDGATTNDSWTKTLAPDAIAHYQDLNPNHQGNLVLGDTNANGLADDPALDLVMTDRLANTLLTSSPQGDVRVTLIGNAIAAQLNDYNDYGHSPNGLLEAAVKWLTSSYTAGQLTGGNVDTVTHNGIIDSSEYSITKGAAKFTSPMPVSDAWNAQAAVLAADSPDNYEGFAIKASGLGLSNALASYNAAGNGLVVSLDGLWIGWGTSGSISDVHPNNPGVFWEILYDHGVAGVYHG